MVICGCSLCKSSANSSLSSSDISCPCFSFCRIGLLKSNSLIFSSTNSRYFATLRASCCGPNSINSFSATLSFKLYFSGVRGTRVSLNFIKGEIFSINSSNLSSSIVAQKWLLCAFLMSSCSLATLFTVRGNSPIISIILSRRVSYLSVSFCKVASDTSTISFSKRMALKSASETVLKSGLTTLFRKDILSSFSTVQKLSSSIRCNSFWASRIITELFGSIFICLRHFTISFSAIPVLFWFCASSILFNRKAKRRIGKGICAFNSFPRGFNLKYSKLSQQSRIKKSSFCVHQGLILSASSKRVPRPIICQNFV